MTADRAFHMPIWKSAFLDADTHAAMIQLIGKRFPSQGFRLIGFITEYIFPGERTRVVRSAQIRLLCKSDDGVLFRRSVNDYLHIPFKDEFSELTSRWVSGGKGLSKAAHGILPKHFGKPELDPTLYQTYLHIQTENFGFFGRSNLHESARKHASEISGVDNNLDARRYHLNMILPLTETAHEKMEQLASYPAMEKAAIQLYSFLMHTHTEPLPLAPLEFSQAVKCV